MFNSGCGLQQAGIVLKLTILEQKIWFSIVQYTHSSIWEVKYIFYGIVIWNQNLQKFKKKKKKITSYWDFKKSSIEK